MAFHADRCQPAIVAGFKRGDARFLRAIFGLSTYAQEVAYVHHRETTGPLGI